MKKNTFILGLLIAGLMVVGTGLSYADEDLHIHGFGDIVYHITDEAHDGKGLGTALNPDNAGKNNKENKFTADAEVDFWKKQGNVTFRLDLDFPGGGIEQVKFDWAIPAGESVGLNLTGGVFNSNIAWEKVDAPDLYQISHGQIFDLIPANLAGVELGVNQGMFSASLIYANDASGASKVESDAGVVGSHEENSIGIKASFTPIPPVTIRVGYLTRDVGNEDLLDVTLTGTLMPNPTLELLWAVEYLTDDNNDALGLTAHASHGHHGLTIRYDQVDNGATEPTSLTIAASCELEDNLAVLLEWRTDDNDAGVENDTIQLEFVTTF